MSERRTGQTIARVYPTMTVQLPDRNATDPYLREIDSNRWYTNFGPLANRLATRLAERYGDGTVCTMANATLGLTLALQEAAEKRPGGACLLPSWTFAASAHAVLASGLRPYFVDVDPDSGQLTQEIAATALGRNNVAAVLVVSVFGQSVEPRPWEAFREAHGVAVVIDGAGAFDTVVASDLPTVVSMHATKPVTSAEGAFVLSRDATLVERLRRRSNFGFDTRRCAQSAGLNAKMSEYHAAIGHASLDEWPTHRARLMAVGHLYRERLAAVPGVTLPPGWARDWIGTALNIGLPEPKDAATVCARLASAGIEARQWWGCGCHRQPAFSEYGRDALPATEALARGTLGLPFSAGLSAADVDYVVERLVWALERV